jgi:hypothetical protein
LQKRDSLDTEWENLFVLQAKQFIRESFVEIFTKECKAVLE